MRFRLKPLLSFVRILATVSGFFFLFLCILAFTTIPFYARYRLGTIQGCIDHKPALIVQMGGSGMPSEDGLLRVYYTSMAAKTYPGTRIILAFPGSVDDTLSSPVLFKQELILHGVNDSLIDFEHVGRNTRQQALKIAEMMKGRMDTGTVVLVTSPEHMYRAILSFRKAGFRNVKGLPTFERSVGEKELYYDDRELKGNVFLPPVGHNKQIRYQFWNHLKYEILVLREYTAILYYWLRAWI